MGALERHACAACALRFRGETSREAYARTCAPLATREDGTRERACAFCLGILQIAVHDDAPSASSSGAADVDDEETKHADRRVLDIASTREFAWRARARGHAPASFKLDVILPAAVHTRERAARARPRDGESGRDVTPIDAVLRALVCPLLSRALGCEEDAENAAYALTAKYKYRDDDKETRFLAGVPLKLTAREREERNKYRASARNHWRREKGSKRKRGGGGAADAFFAHLSSPEDPFEEEFAAAKRAYGDAGNRLAQMDDEMFLDVVNEPPAPEFPARCVLEAFHQPAHVGGWYVKLDRGVPQSRWISRESGERIGRGSVVESIESVVLEHMRSRGAKFNSSGREDMDVRMLSDGRPFALQVHDPKRARVDAEDVAAMERDINARYETTGVRVRGLCLTSKACYHAVGQASSEHEKEKSYVAVVRLSRPATREDHEKIASTSRLVIQQATPTRVVHRRSDMVRPRTIVSMSSEEIPGSPDSVLLRLRTQAGTYVKEFVHGDGGRTTPSLGTLLDCRANIIQLDVTAINDDWNPKDASMTDKD